MNERLDIEIGTEIAGFRIERELGRGAMAVVYLARQQDLDRQVALKLLPPSLAKDEDYIRRFRNEARSVASLLHPHIVQIFQAGVTEEGLHYLSMEYIDGPTLLERIRKQGPLPIIDVLDIAIDIADALASGWRHQMLTHGDIKPENIMQTAAGRVKLADFGLARVSGHDYVGDEVMVTPWYAAPELLNGQLKAGNCQSDIYAFGATFYHALVGRPPFPSEDPKTVIHGHLTETPEPIAALRPDTPPPLAELLERMLAKEPAERPADWEEVLAELKPVREALILSQHIDNEDVTIEEQSRFSRLATWTIRLVNVILAGVLLLLLGLALITTGKAAEEPRQDDVYIAKHHNLVEIPLSLTHAQLELEAYWTAALYLAEWTYEPNNPRSWETLFGKFDDWMSQYKFSDYAVYVDFLQKSAIPALGELSQILAVDSKAIEGETLKEEDGVKYTFGGMADGLFVIHEIRRHGKLTVRMDWAALMKAGYLDTMVTMVGDLFNGDAYRLRPYLAYLVLVQHVEEDFPLLEGVQDLQMRMQWQQICRWCQAKENQRRSLEDIRRWRRLRRLCGRGSFLEAYKLARELHPILSAAMRPLEPALVEIEKTCEELIPENRGGEMVRESLQSLRQGDGYGALALALGASARYGNSRLPEAEKEGNRRMIEKALEQIEPGMGKVAEGRTAAMVGLAMVRPQNERWPCGSLLALRRGAAGGRPETARWMEALGFAARLEMGDWAYLADRDVSTEETSPFAEEDIIGQWTYAYAKSLVALRYAPSWAVCDGMMAALGAKVSRQERAVCWTLAANYALLRRRPVGADSENFLFWTGKEKLQGTRAECRRLMYVTLAALMEGDRREEVQALLPSIKQQGALFFDETDNELMTELWRQVNGWLQGGGDLRLPCRLKDRELPDIQARVMLATAGRQSLSDINDTLFLNWVESEGAGWQQIGGDMVYDWLLRRLAHCLAQGNFIQAKQLLDRCMALRHSCMFPYYPRLLLLQAGLFSLAGNDDGRILANRAMGGAVVASTGEKRLAKTFAKKPQELKPQGDGVQTGAFMEAFLAACYLAGKGQSPEPVLEAAKVSSMPWAERGLLESLRQWTLTFGY